MLAEAPEPFVSQAYVYLSLTAEANGPQETEKIPLVLFPAAEPRYEGVLDDAADPFVSLAYVYFLRVETAVTQTLPNAKIPLVLFPAAEPKHEAHPDDVADPFVSVEYVYLLRSAYPYPNANIPTKLVPAAA